MPIIYFSLFLSISALQLMNLTGIGVYPRAIVTDGPYFYFSSNQMCCGSTEAPAVLSKLSI